MKSPGTPPNFDNNGSDNREPNLMTIRYAANFTPSGGWTSDINGVGVGFSGNCVGANIPMNSTHSGGANVVFADGSVRFVSDATPLVTLGQLATRDDATVIANY